MMKKNIGLVLVLVLIGMALYGFLQKETKSQNTVAYLGQEEQVEEKLAPDFTLQTLDGETLTLSELRGKKVILNFWATWCPPCRTEMPHLQEYYEKYSETDNVEIVAVNATYREQSEEKVQQFIDSFNLTFPIALANEEETLNLYEVLTIPSTFFIDTDGQIQHYIVGPLDESAVHDYVQKLN